MAFRDQNPEPSVIVHEATHALLDIKKAYIRHKTGEAAAFLAQAIYNRLRSDLGKKLSTGRHAFMHSALDAAAEVAEKAKILSYTTTNRSTGEYKLEYKKGVYLEQKHLDEIRNGVTQAGYTNDDRILKEYLGLDLPTVKTGDMPPEPRLPEGLIKKR